MGDSITQRTNHGTNRVGLPYDNESPFSDFTILTQSAKLLSDIANHHKS